MIVSLSSSMIDLHSHSRASDGSFTQRDLVAHAVEAGISTLALTDHDSVSGNAEAAHAAFSLGIGFLPGVELDIEWKPGECHLLGYGIGSRPAEAPGAAPTHEAPGVVLGAAPSTVTSDTVPRRSYGNLRAPEGLAALLVRLNEDRRNRNREIVAKMREGGIDIDLERVEALSGGGTVGRPHFAQFLVEAKVVKNRQQAFDRYLAKDRPYYIDRKSIPLDEAIEAIRASGGVPVLAMSPGAISRVSSRISAIGASPGSRPGIQRPVSSTANALSVLPARLAFSSPRAAISTAPRAPTARSAGRRVAAPSRTVSCPPNSSRSSFAPIEPGYEARLFCRNRFLPSQPGRYGSRRKSGTPIDHLLS